MKSYLFCGEELVAVVDGRVKVFAEHPEYSVKAVENEKDRTPAGQTTLGRGSAQRVVMQ